jgi:hypothetical protein
MGSHDYCYRLEMMLRPLLLTWIEVALLRQLLELVKID